MSDTLHLSRARSVKLCLLSKQIPGVRVKMRVRKSKRARGSERARQRERATERMRWDYGDNVSRWREV